MKNNQLYVCCDGFYPMLFPLEKSARHCMHNYGRIAATSEGAAQWLSRDWSTHTKTSVSYINPGDVIFLVQKSSIPVKEQYTIYNVISGEKVGWIVLLSEQDQNYPSIRPLIKQEAK